MSQSQLSQDERASTCGRPRARLLLLLQSVAEVTEEEEKLYGARRSAEPRRREVNSVCYWRGPKITGNAVNMNDVPWVSHANL